MGNIEIRQESQNKKRPQIFRQRMSKTPTKSFMKKSLSPLSQKYQQYSPIKFFKKNKQTQDYRGPLTQRKDLAQILNTSRTSNPKTQKLLYLQNNRNSNDFNQTARSTNYNNKSHLSKMIQNDNQLIFNNIKVKKGIIVANASKLKKQRIDQQNQSYQNKEEKCVQIIKKVRNFNDFLNQIKKKLKQQTNVIKKHQFQSQTNQKSNIEKVSNEIKEQKKQQKKIQISLKLENQKIQLQKYRNLVERELSKNHSIENIILSTKKSGQKILTIQYQNLNIQKMNSKNQLKENKLFQEHQEPFSQNQGEKEQKRSEQITKSRNEINFNNSKQFKEKNVKTDVKRLKNKFNKTMKKMNQLGSLIQILERQQIQDCKSSIQPKVQNIQNLFNKMDTLQQQCLSTDRWIKEYMQQRSLNKPNRLISKDIKGQNKNILKNEYCNKFNESSVRYQLSSQQQEDSQSAN